jgi:hypothetical protein
MAARCRDSRFQNGSCSCELEERTEIGADLAITKLIRT